MRVLLFISCALAVASSSYAPHYYPQAVLGLDGHPVETPEVQIARAAHYAAHDQALSRVAHGIPYAPAAYYGIAPGAVAHDGRPLDTPVVAAAKQQHHHDYAVAAARNGVGHGVAYAPAAHYGIVPGVVALDGRPLDTPEVAVAKQQHYHDFAVAAARNGVAVGHGLVGPLAVAGPHPVDTPEVQHAKAAHFAAHAEAASRSHGHYRRRREVHAYPQHLPLIDAKGVPVDTPAVQAARAHHLAAHAEASLRSGHLSYVPQIYGYPLYGASPLAYSSPHLVGALLDHAGHPVDTLEVQQAKAAHFAAHAAAHHHLY